MRTISISSGIIISLLVITFIVYNVLLCNSINRTNKNASKSKLNDLYTDTSTAGIGYGKLFFYKNCSACHGPRDGYKNAPTTFDLNKFDSLELQNKLKNIKSDSVHKHFIEPIEYSDKEIISIREFIKDYFNPRY